MGTLCAICNNFQGRWPIDSWSESHKHRREGNRSFANPDFTWQELSSSAKTCYICGILMGGCHGVFKHHDIKQSDIERCSLRFQYPGHTEDTDGSDCDKHLIFKLRSGRRFEVELFMADDQDDEDNEGLCPETWDYFPTVERTSPKTDSPEALETIKDWVGECSEDHTDDFCKHPDCPELPKRVVHVGHIDGVVKLVEPQGATGQYVCLSHCWGLEQIITTTKSTLEERLKGILWGDLSKTFQDAITMTRRLGFQYIWIDSLCIVQDSSEDWQIESANMAAIYSNGFLTIAGTKSSNGRGGLFAATPDFSVAGLTPEDEYFKLFFRERIDHQIDTILESPTSTSTETYYPLLSRAWVYQERMLSTRVLHFGRYELFFECKSAVRCECGDFGGSEIPEALIKIEYAYGLSHLHDAYAAKQHKAEALETVNYHVARLWRTMVCCYTALNLTKSKDRLPAFGGLARQMASERRSRYLAGLWANTLNNDLLWFVYGKSTLKSARPEPRNAPTWSWASIESMTGVDYTHPIIYTDLEGDSFEAQPPHQHFSSIESCEVTKVAVDEFGAIDRGTLKITGLVAEGVLERETEMHDNEECAMHYISFPNARIVLQSDYLLDEEGPCQVLPGTNVLCLRMSMLREGQKDALISLVLKKLSSPSEDYERIGGMRIVGPKETINPLGGIYESASHRTVTIV